MQLFMFMAVSLFVLLGCVGPQEGKVACSPDIMMAPLPEKCGKYDMEYGTISSQGSLLRLKDKQTVHLLDGFTSEGIVGKNVAIAGEYWPQYIGGLLREDGSSTGSYLIHNLLKPTLVQVAGEKGFNKCQLYRWCERAKYER